MGNMVAIVGRPNVGKSTFFNRLTESRDAIVDPTSGVTRDRHYGKAEWIGKSFSVIDTGGYTINSDDVFEKAIKRQVELAIEEASVIMFLVDWESGITDLDEEVAKMLRRANKPVLLVCNKIDSPDKIGMAAEFYKLGLGEVFCISAINGSGTGELLDELVRSFPKDDPESDETVELPKF